MSSLSAQCVRKAEQFGYASLMNDTKWRELCFAFATFEEKPAWRTYDFLTNHVSGWDKDWFYHVGPDYCTIEWLEINPEKCSASKIRDVLKTVGVCFEEAGYFKIFGYRQSK